jgi:cyclopropane fatty-acyl-phospholipid synthase-like methyltransferase
MLKIVTNIQSIVSGQTEALNILQADVTLNDMYLSMSSFDTSDFLHHLGHTKPNMRILQIGSGTGSSTKSIIESLTLPGSMSHTTYSRYTFTSTTAELSPTAKELLNGYSNIDYRVLNISKDPSEQGFSGEKYDLIIATNVLYATKNIGEALKNVHKLLTPGGRLLLQNLHSSSKWPKCDLLGAGRLDMDVFLANRTYSCLNLDELRAKRPDVIKE